MEKWSLAAFMILWNFNSIESGEFCQGIDGQGLELRGSTQLSLTCNTSHLQAYAHFESGTEAVYSIGIACVDTNGSQSAYQIWYMNYFDGTELSSIVPHSHNLGSECTLFGCAAEDFIEYYAMHPAMCVIDEDECSLQTHNCSNRAVCLNTVGGYNCSCQNGYDGDGFSCTDEDECSLQTHNCSNRAVCSNTVGGYNCSCQNGYDGDGFSCNDKDECSSGAQSCSELSLCINTPGGYDCVCLEGYSGDGYSCTGVDECEPECNAHASCVHTDNIPSCVCGQMYEGDGSNCTAKNSHMDGIALEVSVIAATVSLLLCLVITAAVIIVTICCRRKHTWLSRIIDEWEVQKLDKNFHPVDPACVLSGSVKSVIEPLWEEQFLTLEQTNQDASGLQPQALNTSTRKSDITVREKKRCADEEQQFLSVSTVNDVCAEHSSQLQSCTYEVADPQSDISIRDSSAESLDSKRPGAPFTSAFRQTKDESGFVSDTSSSVYLTFYPLNNNNI